MLLEAALYIDQNSVEFDEPKLIEFFVRCVFAKILANASFVVI